MTFPADVTAEAPPLPYAVQDGRALDNGIRVGTVTSVSPLTVDVSGGTISKIGVLGSARLAVGMVVSLIRENESWLVLGDNVSSADVSGQAASKVGSATTSTASGSYTEVSGALATSFTKNSGFTRVAVHFGTSSFTNTVATAVSFVLTFTGPAALDVQLGAFFFNVANVHASCSGHQIVALPAGTYGVTVRWARSAGAGTLFVDGNDLFSYTVQEVF